MLPVSARHFALALPDEEDEKRDPFAHTKTPSSQDTERKHGGSGLMHKIFRKHNSKDSKAFESLSLGEEEVRDNFYDSFQERIRSGELAGVVNPCPFIRPLEHRLQPRDEQVQLSSRNSVSSEQIISPITIARNRGEANRMLAGRISDEDLMALLEDDIPVDSKIEKVDKAKMEVYVHNALHIDTVAIALSSDDQGAARWQFYLECYSKGNFNLSSPPDSPTRNSSFVYLPAVFPFDETNRMSLWNQYNILWPQWAQNTACGLVKLATKKFLVSHAALSFFDEKHELFKVENGYNHCKIDRATSIAAHVLCSTEVLVVLDAKKDWRFKGNPLVEGPPGIRFFAGAPMLSTEGQVIGVFAVFDQNPRPDFGPLQRRELAELSTIAMADLNVQADWMSDPDLRTTPILERESIINCDYRPRSTKSSVPELDNNTVDAELCPPALRFHKARSHSKNLSRLYINSQNRDIFLRGAENTPPSSGEDENGSFFENPKGFGKNRQLLSTSPGANRISNYYHMLAPDSREFRVSTPRPFSSSDLTSLYPHPPNTPILLSSEGKAQPDFELTIEQFMALSDKDCLEEVEEKELHENTLIQGTPAKGLTDIRSTQSSPLIDLSSPAPPLKNLTVIGSTQINPFVDLPFPGPPPKSPPPPNPRQHTPPQTPFTSLAIRSFNSSQDKRPLLAPATSLRLNRQSDISTVRSLQTSGANGQMAEAAFACSMTAQNLGYDLIYAVEVKALRPFMTDAELTARGGMQMKILVAYGLSKPLTLSSEIHLKALRARGYELWENDQADYESGEYAWGCLVPLPSDIGPIRHRSNGIIIGAFRLPKLIEVGEERNIAADLKKLMEAAATLKGILCKPLGRKTPKRSNTEPTAPKSYPVNNGSELKLGKFSLDAGDGRKNRPSSKIYGPLENLQVVKRGSATPSRYLANEASEVHLPDSPIDVGDFNPTNNSSDP